MTKRKPKRAMRRDTRSAGTGQRCAGDDGIWSFSLDDELLTVGWTVTAEPPARAQPAPAPEITWARDAAVALPRAPVTRPAIKAQPNAAPRSQAMRPAISATAFFSSDTMVFEGDPDRG